MSAFLDRVHHLLDEAKAEFEHLLGHGDDAVKAAAHNAVQRIDAAKAEIEKDAPQLEHEAEADAADVAKTAATEGVIPAEQEAARDAGELAGEVVGDVKTAVEDAAHSPAQTVAVLAGETAVADSGQHA